MTGNTPLKLISMSEINAEEVQWLWYPYIPLGKLTILQGDPGEGKTSFILAVIAALTRGDPLPECEQAAEPMNVIYQTAEDGLADTIKPTGADTLRRKAGRSDPQDSGKADRTRSAAGVPRKRCGYAPRKRGASGTQTTFPDGGAHTMRRHSDRAHE